MSSTQQQVTATAAVVTTDWNPSGLNLPRGLNPLAVRRGQEVWVFRVNQNFALSRRRGHESDGEGWVPLNVLKKGVQRVTNLPIEVPAQVQNFQQTTAQGSSQTPSANVLQETLRELWRMIPASRNTINQVISNMPEESKAIFFHQNAHLYGDVVYNAIVPQARTIMANGSFQVEHLRTLPQVTAGWPKAAGVYLIIYGGFGGRKTGNTIYETAIYVGQTVNFYKRMDRHMRNRANRERSTHYLLAAKATEVRMVPLLIQNTDSVPEGFLDIAEFSMVALLGSWFAGLFRPLDPATYGAYSIDHEACMMFSRLMMAVSNRCGWSRGRTYGLNWKTPIVRDPRFDMKWTAWYDDSTSNFVYRTRKVLHVSPGEVNIHWHGSGIGLQVPLEVANDAGFKDGQSVHLIVEVRKRGDQYLTHLTRYVRFPPMIGRNPRLEQLRALAIKIQWLPEGATQWKQYYIERSRLWQPIGGGNDVLRIYRTGLMVLNDVEKIRYTGGPDWLRPLAPTGIQFLRYNHLEQKLTVEMVSPTVKPWPQDNTMQQNTQRLLQLFPPASSPNTVIGRQPASGFFPRARRACDICLTQRTTTPCRFDPQDNSCQCCRALNRPCTWSRGGLNITDQFVHPKPLEELGIAVNISRDQFSQIKNLEVAPIELDVEGQANDDLGG